MDISTKYGVNINLEQPNGDLVATFTVGEQAHRRELSVILDDESLITLENWLIFRRETKTELREYPMCSNHVEVQHRDRLPPWCNSCGWSHGRPAVKARKYGTGA